MKFGTWEHFGQTDQAVEFIESSPPDRPIGDQVWCYADLEPVSAKNPAGFRIKSGELKGRPLDLILRSETAGLLP